MQRSQQKYLVQQPRAKAAQSHHTRLSKNNMSDRNPYDNSFAPKRSESFYLDEPSSDVNFLFVAKDGSEQRIVAHKIVLATYSEVFYAMFFGDMKETGDITIVDASYDAFKEFLQFFYFDKVSLTIENIADVMHLVSKYIVLECMETCDKFLAENLQVENVWNGIQLADLYGRNVGKNDLKQTLIKMICNNLEEAFSANSSLECTQGLLKEILESNELKCPSMQTFKVCLDWAKRKCLANNLEASMENCKEALSDCIRLIPFKSMSFEELTDSMSTYTTLFDPDILAEIMETVQWEEALKELPPPPALPPVRVERVHHLPHSLPVAMDDDLRIDLERRRHRRLQHRRPLQPELQEEWLNEQMPQPRRPLRPELQLELLNERMPQPRRPLRPELQQEFLNEQMPQPRRPLRPELQPELLYERMPQPRRPLRPELQPESLNERMLLQRRYMRLHFQRIRDMDL